jgi:hypothetical protein
LVLETQFRIKYAPDPTYFHVTTGRYRFKECNAGLICSTDRRMMTHRLNLVERAIPVPAKAQRIAIACFYLFQCCIRPAFGVSYANAIDRLSPR